MRANIIGIGTASPEKISTDRYIEHAKRFSCSNQLQERILEELYRKTLISNRCSVLAKESYGTEADNVFVTPRDTNDRGPGTFTRMQHYIQEVTPLAVKASDLALKDAKVSAAEITHLVTVSCTGFQAPGFDIALIDKLSLPRNTARTHVGFMGCHGTMNALRVAKAFVDSDETATVLICSAELCSLHFQYGWSPDTLVANSLFADGAAALVMRKQSQKLAGHFELMSSASHLLPDSLDMMSWKVGDHGFFMHLSSKVPDLVQEHLPGFLTDWLASYGLTPGDIGGWAVHAGGPRILDAVRNAIGLTHDKLMHSREVLANYGNMSSPTVVFVFDRLRATLTEGPHIMLGFGPGLTIEAALLK